MLFFVFILHLFLSLDLFLALIPEDESCVLLGGVVCEAFPQNNFVQIEPLLVTGHWSLEVRTSSTQLQPVPYVLSLLVFTLERNSRKEVYLQDEIWLKF